MSETTSSPPAEREGLRWSAWNLLLLVPLLILVTPWWNAKDPVMFGMPFFYWIQLAFVLVGVVCTAVVYLMTQDEPHTAAPGEPLGVDDLDEGSLR